MSLKIYAIIALVVGVGLFGLWLHNVIDDRDTAQRNEKFERAEKEKAIKTISDITAEQAHTNSVLEVYHDAEDKIVYVDRIVTKQVIEYRDLVPNRVQLDARWVRAYNDSTDELHSENPSVGTNDSTGTLAKIVNDADALEVATSNNRSCVRTISRLRALQEWAEHK